MIDLVMLAGKPKVEQIQKSGASVVTVACENCRLQLGDLSSHYGAGFSVIAIADLVVKAMRFPGVSKTIESSMASASVETEKLDKEAS